MKRSMQINRQWLCVSLFLCFCLLVFSFTPASANGATLPRTAKLIPAETILLVDIDDFTELRKQFEKTNLYKLIKDPAMSPFVDDVKARWRERKKDDSDDKIPGILRDVDVLPRGRVAIAVVLNEQTKDTNDPPILFMTQWGEEIGKVKEAAEKNIEKAIAEGARREAEDYRGVDITTMTGESSKALSFCFIDDSLIGSVSPDVLKFVIAQIKGTGSPTLGDDEEYNTTLRALGAPDARQASLYVNIKQIIKTALAEDADGKVRTIINNLGLSNVTSFAGAVDLAGGPGGAALGKALLKIDGEKKGICKMLEVESAGLRIPRFIPASSSSVSVFHLNIKKAFAELCDILGNFSPQMPAMLYMPLVPSSAQGKPPLILKTGIIDHLGSQIVLAQSTKKPSPDSSDAAPTGQLLMAIATDNRNALEKSLSLLHGTFIAPNSPEARRELLGHTIYSIDLSKFLPFLTPAAKGPNALDILPSGFTVTDTHFIFASEAAIERTIRALESSTESINSAKWFARAKANIPSAVGLAGLEDTAATTEQLWFTMRESKKEDKGERSKNELGVSMSTDSLFPQLTFSPAGSGFFDVTLLPEFDAVRKYFGVSAFYGLSRPDGFFFEFKYLDPVDTE